MSMDKEKLIIYQLMRQIIVQRRKVSNQQHSSFDRFLRKIVSILKQFQVPLSNKQILDKLTKECELSITLKNLTCTILLKMNSDRSLPVQRAYRRYWQYKLLNKEGNLSL